MKSVGIIGFGSYGKYLFRMLKGDFLIKIYDKDVNVSKDINASLEEVAGCEFLILAIPYSAYNEVLEQIRQTISNDTVIIDICSVKVKPIKKLKSILPDQSYISVHPLFGPESAPQDITNQTIVICDSNCRVKDQFVGYLKKSGLKIEYISAEEHDREMAVIQGVTFFLAKGLNEFGLHQMKLKTPSFQKLLDLAYLDNHHSDELLQTIFQDNRYSTAKRTELIKALEDLNKKF